MQDGVSVQILDKNNVNTWFVLLTQTVKPVQEQNDWANTNKLLEKLKWTIQMTDTMLQKLQDSETTKTHKLRHEDGQFQVCDLPTQP